MVNCDEWFDFAVYVTLMSLIAVVLINIYLKLDCLCN